MSDEIKQNYILPIDDDEESVPEREEFGFALRMIPDEDGNYLPFYSIIANDDGGNIYSLEVMCLIEALKGSIERLQVLFAFMKEREEKYGDEDQSW